jgi:bifunctional non-homologous end joining protein LigD
LRTSAGRDVRLYSRNRLPQHLPVLSAAVAALPAEELILDGETTWDGSGTYHVFDILWLNGRALTSLPIEERRAALQTLPLTPPLRPVDVIDDPAPWERARREGWEGCDRQAPRLEVRAAPLAALAEDEVRSRRRSLSSAASRIPRAAASVLGRCWSATTTATTSSSPAGSVPALIENGLLELRARLDRLEVPTSPFTRAVGLPRLRAHWVRPEIVVQVAFLEWTVHGKLRHPRLLGVRTDKSRARRREGTTVTITHPEKVLFPADGITKGEVAAYDEALAPVILRHLAGRPITMDRYPAGIGQPGSG